MLSLSVLTIDNAECKFAWSLTHVFHCTFAIIQVNLTSCTLTHSLPLFTYYGTFPHLQDQNQSPLMGAEKVFPNLLLMEFLCLSLLPYNLDIIFNKYYQVTLNKLSCPRTCYVICFERILWSNSSYLLEFTANISQKHFLLPGSEPYFYIFIACA